jgi:hypothetical protein
MARSALGARTKAIAATQAAHARIWAIAEVWSVVVAVVESVPVSWMQQRRSFIVARPIQLPCIGGTCARRGAAALLRLVVQRDNADDDARRGRNPMESISASGARPSSAPSARDQVGHQWLL